MIFEGFLIAFARLSGFFLTAPFFSSKLIFRQAKVILLVLLSVSFSLVFNLRFETAEYGVIAYLSEFLMGLMMGLVASFLINMVQFAGAIVDHQVGFGVSRSAGIDGVMSTVTSRMMEFFALLLFFLLNGHMYLLYVLFSQDLAINIFHHLAQGEVSLFFAGLFQAMVMGGFGLAVPFILTFMTIDISLGIVNKTFQKFSVFLFSLPLKVGMYFFVLFYYVYFFAIRFPDLHEGMLGWVKGFIEVIR